MVKVVVTLAAAAGALFGRIVEADIAASKSETKKEILQQQEKTKPIFKKSNQNDTQLA